MRATGQVFSTSLKEASGITQHSLQSHSLAVTLSAANDIAKALKQTFAQRGCQTGGADTDVRSFALKLAASATGTKHLE